VEHRKNTEAPPSRIGSGRTGRFVSVAPRKQLYPVGTEFKHNQREKFLGGVNDGEVACKRDSVGRYRSGDPMAIHLCGLPEGCPWPDGHERTGRSLPLLGLAPDGVYRADAVTDIAGALLPHRFTLTCDRVALRRPGPSAVCSLLHLSVRSPRPGSRQHPALWSPDFPRRCSTQRRDHPATSPSAPSLRWTADLVNKLRK